MGRIHYILKDPAQGAAELCLPNTCLGKSLTRLFDKEIDVLGLGKTIESTKKNPYALFPGAFNPLHSGHINMAKWAKDSLKIPIIFELSVVNVDKPPLKAKEIAERMNLFTNEALFLTQAPTFVGKASLFPKVTFLVGIDTIVRIDDLRYYSSKKARDRAIETIAQRGCRFLVFGRNTGSSFRHLDSVELKEDIRALCLKVNEAHFREDISSTEIRSRRNRTY